MSVRPIIVNYIPLTIKVVPDISASGKVTLSISGDYFNGSFGVTSNTLAVQYRYKNSKTTVWPSWVTANVSISDGYYNATIEIDGLDYTQQYDFTAQAIDKVRNVLGSQTIKFLPVFDWSKSDFNFNVPVEFKESVKFDKEIIGNGIPKITSGTFTPTTISEPDFCSEGFTVAKGIWTRIDNLVHISLHVEGICTNDGVSMKIDGLPFSVDSDYPPVGSGTFEGMHYYPGSNSGSFSGFTIERNYIIGQWISRGR